MLYDSISYYAIVHDAGRRRPKASEQEGTGVQDSYITFSRKLQEMFEAFCKNETSFL